MAQNKKDTANTAAPAELCQADADDVTRHSFRGQVNEAARITATINGEHHTVVDIGSRGLGILLAKGTALVPGQTHDFTLALGKQTIALKGLIRHVTRDDEAGAFHCGIELLALDHATEQQLQEFVLRQRHQLFTRPPA